jgi:hypothetical protein
MNKHIKVVKVGEIEMLGMFGPGSYKGTGCFGNLIVD